MAAACRIAADAHIGVVHNTPHACMAAGYTPIENGNATRRELSISVTLLNKEKIKRRYVASSIEGSSMKKKKITESSPSPTSTPLLAGCGLSGWRESAGHGWRWRSVA
jgi:hypothetical protein